MTLYVAGNVINVRVCESCKKSLEAISGYAKTFPASHTVTALKTPPKAKENGVKPTKVQTAKYDRYALSKEEIAATQALRPSVRMADSPRKREMDDLDKVAAGKRVTIFAMGQGKLKSDRNKKVGREARAKLGTENVRCIKDDGFEAVFEAA